MDDWDQICAHSARASQRQFFSMYQLLLSNQAKIVCFSNLEAGTNVTLRRYCTSGDYSGQLISVVACRGHRAVQGGAKDGSCTISILTCDTVHCQTYRVYSKFPDGSRLVTDASNDNSLNIRNYMGGLQLVLTPHSTSLTSICPIILTSYSFQGHLQVSMLCTILNYAGDGNGTESVQELESHRQHFGFFPTPSTISQKTSKKLICTHSAIW